MQAIGPMQQDQSYTETKDGICDNCTAETMLYTDCQCCWYCWDCFVGG